MPKELKAISVSSEIRIEIEKILSPGHRLLHEVFLEMNGEEHLFPVNIREKWYHAVSPNRRTYIIYFDGFKYSNTDTRRYSFLFACEGEKIPVKKLEDYILVYQHNEKEMIKEGRIIHIIENKKLLKSIIISPCERMGKKPTPNLMSQEDATRMCSFAPDDYNLWKDWWRGLVDECKSRRCLYVNKKEKLVTFTWK